MLKFGEYEILVPVQNLKTIIGAKYFAIASDNIRKCSQHPISRPAASEELNMVLKSTKYPSSCVRGHQMGPSYNLLGKEVGVKVNCSHNEEGLARVRMVFEESGGDVVQQHHPLLVALGQLLQSAQQTQGYER